MGKSVDIVFVKSVDGLCEKGETKTVKLGYYNNFLEPQQLAILQTLATKSQLEGLKTTYKEKQSALKKRALEYSDVLSGKSFDIIAKSHDKGKLYGSIGSKDIIKLINSDASFDIKESHILIPNKLFKELGQYRFSIKLHPDVVFECNLSILPEVSIEKPAKETKKVKKLSRPVGTKPETPVKVNPKALEDKKPKKKEKPAPTGDIQIPDFD